MCGKRLHRARVRGFCRGVERAIGMFDEALHLCGTPVYVLHELVHNSAVTAGMRERGAIFVDCIDDVPSGSVLLLGAHGVGRQVEEIAADGRFRVVVNAVCPFVRRLHEVASSVLPEEDLVLFGKAGHSEAIGIVGHAGTLRCHIVSEVSDIDRLPPLVRPTYLVQTTMNREESERILECLRVRYPEIRHGGGVCSSSLEHQRALDELCSCCDGILVIGSSHSSNAMRLVEGAHRRGCAAWLVDEVSSIPSAAMEVEELGVIGGASVPVEVFDRICATFAERGYELI